MILNNINIELGLVQVDTTYCSIQPIQYANNMLTLREQEMYHHKKNALLIIDTRKPAIINVVSIPGSKNIPYDEIVKRMKELDENLPIIFFCNGPQCPIIKSYKEHFRCRFPANKILYYSGGMHNWITLGLPVQRI